MNGSTGAAVLLVDADADALKSQTERLARLGYTLVTTVEAAEALALLQGRRFDLLVIAQNTGTIDCVDLFQTVRQRGCSAAVVVITRFDDPQLLIRAVRAGLRDFVPRTAEYLDDLPLALERALQHPEGELAQANARLKAFNERLQAGMAESHHRIKNSLQNVISLLNLQVRKTGSLTGEDVKKLSAHIHGLAVLHDLLIGQSREDGEVSSITLDRIFERVIGVLTRSGGSRRIDTAFETCLVTPRQAASLTVIFNELVSNALKHGTGSIAVSLENRGSTAVLKVKNEGSQFVPAFAPDAGGQTGLALVKILSSTDLASEPKFENTDGWAVVAVTLPLLPTRKSNPRTSPGNLVQ